MMQAIIEAIMNTVDKKKVQSLFRCIYCGRYRLNVDCD